MTSSNKGWILLTNDDGIEAPGFEGLVKALHHAGHRLIVLAPSQNNSATGMHINLMQPMEWRSRQDLVSTWDLNGGQGDVHLFELDGTPCDTMIVALDGGLEHLVPGIIPQLVVSGVNLGPNLSQDAYHSGTMGAAREAGLYGMPAIATSFTSFEIEGMQRAIEATVEVVEQALRVLPQKPRNKGRPNGTLETDYFAGVKASNDLPKWDSDPDHALLEAFKNGDLMLNLNTPPHWNGTYSTTRLGVRWYRNAVRFAQEGNESTATFTIGAASVDHSPVEHGDCDAVEFGQASLSCLAVWPQSHPFALDDDLLNLGIELQRDGWPRWLKQD